MPRFIGIEAGCWAVLDAASSALPSRDLQIHPDDDDALSLFLLQTEARTAGLRVMILIN